MSGLDEERTYTIHYIEGVAGKTEAEALAERLTPPVKAARGFVSVDAPAQEDLWSATEPYTVAVLLLEHVDAEPLLGGLPYPYRKGGSLISGKRMSEEDV